jgi:hypothetical protein
MANTRGHSQTLVTRAPALLLAEVETPHWNIEIVDSEKPVIRIRVEWP